MFKSILRWRGEPDRTEEILGRHLDGDFRAFPMAEGKCSRGQLQAIEKRFGVKYPEQFTAHVLGRFPGIYIEVKEELWPRPQPYAVGPFWSFLYALHTYTAAPGSESWMRLDVAAEEFMAQELRVAPILRIVGDADVYCTTPEGMIVRLLHETGELEPVHSDFWTLFENQIQALRDRKIRKQRGS
jgi:hypothetical protein